MPHPLSNFVFDIRIDPPDCEVRPKPKLQPRKGDTVRIDRVMDVSTRVWRPGTDAEQLHVPGFVGVAKRVVKGDFEETIGWYAVHFDDETGAVWSQVTVLERELVDGNAPQKPIAEPRIDAPEWEPQVGDRVRVVEVSSFLANDLSFREHARPKLGSIGVIAGSNRNCLNAARAGEGWSHGEQLVAVEKREENPKGQTCYWCGEPKDDRAFAEQRCGACGTVDDVARVAAPLYQQRLDAGGLNDCHAERMAVRRAEKTVADYRRPSCTCCGSKEGMPDGYGQSKHVKGLARSEEQRDRSGGGAVCITCVQKGFRVLNRIAESFEKQEPEPGAAPHWPAQHSSPGWED